jgi:hypothetical protein
VPLPPFISDPIQALLTANDFRRLRRRELYVREFPDGLAAIQFVRDKYPSLPSEARFTAHLGFTSHRLGAVFGTEPLTYVGPDKMPWFRWIGYLSEGDRGYPGTWEVEASDSASVAHVLNEVRGRGIPALIGHADDRALRDEWLDHADPFLHRAVQTSYLAVLVKALGPTEELAELESRVRKLAEAGSSDARAALRILDD